MVKPLLSKYVTKLRVYPFIKNGFFRLWPFLCFTIPTHKRWKQSFWINVKNVMNWCLRPYLKRKNRDLLLSSHFIKLITGPRRVGRSIQALLMLRDKNFAYLNFHNHQLLEVWDADLVMRCMVNSIWSVFKMQNFMFEEVVCCLSAFYR